LRRLSQHRNLPRIDAKAARRPDRVGLRTVPVRSVNHDRLAAHLHAWTRPSRRQASDATLPQRSIS